MTASRPVSLALARQRGDRGAAFSLTGQARAADTVAAPEVNDGPLARMKVGPLAQTLL